MARSAAQSTLPPPYLLKVWLDEAAVPDPAAHPFCLPSLRGFDLDFEQAITRL